MEMKAMPSAMDALLDVRDWIAGQLKYYEGAVGAQKKAEAREAKEILIALYNLLPDEVEEGVVKKEGEEEW